MSFKITSTWQTMLGSDLYWYSTYLSPFLILPLLLLGLQSAVCSCRKSFHFIVSV
jgi:hypothetical protein